jgi:hypothetical protein
MINIRAGAMRRLKQTRARLMCGHDDNAFLHNTEIPDACELVRECLQVTICSHVRHITRRRFVCFQHGRVRDVRAEANVVQRESGIAIIGNN